MLDTILVALQHNYSMALADSPRWISTRVVRKAVDRIAVEREAHLTVGELAALVGVGWQTASSAAPAICSVSSTLALTSTP